jgi:phosphoserine phosphatase
VHQPDLAMQYSCCERLTKVEDMTASRGVCSREPRSGSTKPRPSAVVTDWDNTLAKGFILVPWMEFLSGGGLIPQQAVDEVRVLVENFDPGILPYSEFSAQCLRKYESLMQGLVVAEVIRCASDFARSTYITTAMYPVAHILLAAAREHSVEIHVVSAAPTEPLSACLETLGVSNVTAFEMTTINGRYDATGQVIAGEIEDKAAVVRRLSRTWSIVLGLGDSLSDLPLLQAARRAIVVDGEELSAAAPKDALRIAGRDSSQELKDFVQAALANR